MQNILLKIARLGRIENSQIMLSPLMIFSGESGMGKSYLSIAIHYFFEVLVDKQRLSDFFVSKQLDYNELSSQFNAKEGIAFEVKKSELEDWFSQDVVKYIKYMINNPQLQADIKVTLPDVIPNTITCEYSEEAFSLENDVDVKLLFKLPNLTYRRAKTKVGIDEESPFAYFFRYYLIKNIFGDYQALTQTFVFPPSRGSIMTEKLIPLTGMYDKFLKDKQFLEGANPSPVEVDKNVLDLVLGIMEGKVSLTDNQYFYKMDNQPEMPLSAAASSIRELSIIEMLIEKADISRIAFLFEEPEAHLHPSKQRMMADLIFLLWANGARMQITTHSDYFLKRFNELYQSMQLKKREELFPELSSILPNRDFDEIQAFLLERQEDGSSRIVKQDMQNGVPFTSFYEPLKEGLEMKRKIAEYKEEESDD